MVSPAVAAPPATPGTEGGGDPAPAGDPQVNPTTPPQGEPGTTAPSESGKGGKEPAGGGDPQNQPGQGDESKPQSSQEPATPPAPAPNEPRRLTPEEWQREQAAAKRQLEAQEQETRAKELVSKAPTQVRDLLDTLAEELDVRIPADLRKPVLDLVQELVENADKGAELKLFENFATIQKEHRDYKETLEDTSNAFLKSMEKLGLREQYTNDVRGKDPVVWVDSALKLQRESNFAAQAALLPEGEARDGYMAKVKGLTDPKKIAQAFHDSLVGVVGPNGEPRVASRGGGNGRPSLADVTRRRSNNEYKSDAEFLADQNLALGIQT